MIQLRLRAIVPWATSAPPGIQREPIAKSAPPSTMARTRSGTDAGGMERSQSIHVTMSAPKV